MRKRKFWIFMSLVMALAVVAWSSGDALAQNKGTEEAATQLKEKPPKVIKGKVTRDDVNKYLGKKTIADQKAAEKRNRDLGLLPGVAGFTVQTPESGASR